MADVCIHGISRQPRSTTLQRFGIGDDDEVVADRLRQDRDAMTTTERTTVYVKHQYLACRPTTT